MKAYLLVLLVAAATAQAADTKSGLALYYSFDQNQGDVVKDEGGQGIDGRAFHATVVEDGVRGGGLRLDGKTSYLQAQRNPTDSPEHTVAMWFKPDPARIDNLYDCHLSSMNRRYNFGFWTNGLHYLFFSHCLNMASYGFGACRADSSVFDLLPNRWYHAALVTQDGGVTYYLDGRRIGFTTGPGVNKGDRELIFGACDNGIRHGFFPGWLDEIRIYSRALTDDDMAALHRQDAPSDSFPPAPVALGPSYSLKDGALFLRTEKDGWPEERPLSDNELFDLLSKLSLAHENTAGTASGPVCEVSFSNSEKGDQDVTYFLRSETLHVRVRDVDMPSSDTNLSMQVFLSQPVVPGAGDGRKTLKQLERGRGDVFRGQFALHDFETGDVWISIVATESGGHPLLMRTSRIKILDRTEAVAH